MRSKRLIFFQVLSVAGPPCRISLKLRLEEEEAIVNNFSFTILRRATSFVAPVVVLWDFQTSLTRRKRTLATKSQNKNCRGAGVLHTKFYFRKMLQRSCSRKRSLKKNHFFQICYLFLALPDEILVWSSMECAQKVYNLKCVYTYKANVPICIEFTIEMCKNWWYAI